LLRNADTTNIPEAPKLLQVAPNTKEDVNAAAYLNSSVVKRPSPSGPSDVHLTFAGDLSINGLPRHSAFFLLLHDKRKAQVRA
jgi:hypothetical protein